MTQVTFTLPSDGTTGEAADVNTPFNAIKDVINGNLDNDNIKANAGIAGSKLADASVAFTKITDWDGWIAVSDSWTYASATTITVPSDATTRYSVGDKIKLTQTTVKYFYITGVAATTLTISGGSDYTLANAAITSPSYSKVATPLSFPDEFTYSPTLSGRFTDADWTKACKFRMVGKLVKVRISLTSTDTTPMAGGSANAIFSLPVTSVAAPLGSDLDFIGSCLLGDAGSAIYPGYVSHSSTTTASLFFMDDGASGVRELAVSSAAPMSWTTGDTISARLEYTAG